ncbi:hypothetical protein N864_23575 [Intrasporangium chromatireducens Q5-1]|uniref:SHOCT domain-containing protein n=2 Tax=Intrasporangium TaxID=53357 RepID=W9GV46_9MICO|nr:hypothetical protein N864_23575 [Intrasporangium chromatireducens Q5-1]
MWGHAMSYDMGWWMWVLMALGTLGFWVLVAYVVRAVIQGRPATPSPTSAASGREPLQLLDERLARGEVDADEYQRTRNLLTHT